MIQMDLPLPSLRTSAIAVLQYLLPLHFYLECQKFFFHRGVWMLVNKVIWCHESATLLDLLPLNLKVCSHHLIDYFDISYRFSPWRWSLFSYVISPLNIFPNCSILQLFLCNFRAVTRTCLAGTFLVIADSFLQSYTVTYDDTWRRLGKFNLTVLANSANLFNCISGSQHVTDRRLLVDFSAVQQAYSHRSISELVIVDHKFNIFKVSTETVHFFPKGMTETGYIFILFSNTF